MARSLADLAKAFDNKASGSGGGDQSWKLYYPFWKMDVDGTAVIRFLPDLDEDSNSLGFLVENLTHELTINGEKKKVACLSMFGEACPICALSAKFYDADDETNGHKFYKKRSYIGQIYVVESPIEHDQARLVKYIEFGPKIFKQIQAAFKSGDLEEFPQDLKGGYNFRIKKTKSGNFADYGTSSFSPKQTALDDAIIEKLELVDLKTLRTPRTDVAILEAMLVAAQTGGSLPAESPAPAPSAAQAPSAEGSAPVASAETVAPAASGSSAVDRIRERARAAKAAAEAKTA